MAAAQPVSGHRYTLSPAARMDLDHIWDYTAQQWSVEKADDYLHGIEHSIESVSAKPRIGRPINDVRPGYFRMSVGSHLLIYRIIGNCVDVVRVLHQRMDLDRNL